VELSHVTGALDFPGGYFWNILETIFWSLWMFFSDLSERVSIAVPRHGTTGSLAVSFDSGIRRRAFLPFTQIAFLLAKKK